MTRQKAPDKDLTRARRQALYTAIDKGEITLPDAVKRMRQIARMTQTEFAAHRGVSAKVIKDIERGIGNPTVGTLNKIGKIFGLEVAFVRSERLHAVEPGAGPAVTGNEQAGGVPQWDGIHQLMQLLEDIKRQALPPREIEASLDAMQSRLDTVRNSATAPTAPFADERQHLSTQDIDTGLHAVGEARELVASIEKLQQQIQPPSALKTWLVNLDRASRLLQPLAGNGGVAGLDATTQD